MKNYVMLMLAIAGCIAFSNVKAQKVNDLKLSDLKEEYLEAREYRQLLVDKTFISLDYGQKKDENGFRETVIRDDKGKYLEYNSMIDFVNKMKPYGYELFQVYVMNWGDKSEQKYLLKRKSN